MMKIALVSIVFAASLMSNGAQSKADVAAVKWMTGCWEMNGDKPDSTTLEQWTTADGGALFGVGRTFKGGKLVSWEMMRIVTEAEVSKFYAQLPNAAQATGFNLKSSTADELVFENLQNDFPHRVIYRTGGTDKLTARIEGTINGKSRAVDFSFIRNKCS